jgi:hypothetical protein
MVALKRLGVETAEPIGESLALEFEPLGTLKTFPHTSRSFRERAASRGLHACLFSPPAHATGMKSCWRAASNRLPEQSGCRNNPAKAGCYLL